MHPDMRQASEDRNPHQHWQQFPLLHQLLLSKGTLQAVLRGSGRHKRGERGGA